MNDLEVGKLISRMDSIERITAERHKENTDKIDMLDLKMDTVVDMLSRLKGGWFVLSVLGAVGVAAITLAVKLFNIKFSGS
jgi:hypothetical protein